MQDPLGVSDASICSACPSILDGERSVLNSAEMNEPFLDFYRCPERFGTFALAAELRNEPGYFRFGDDLICFGQCSPGYSSRLPGNGLYDSYQAVSFNHASVRLPFALAHVINNLRLERYVTP